MEGNFIENPPGKHFMTLAIVAFIFFICLGFAFYSLFSAWLARIITLLFSIFVAFLYLIPLTYIEAIRRPKAVLVGDPLIFTYRTREPREIHLEDIERVSVNFGDQTTLAGRINTGGCIWLKGDSKNIFLTYEIGELIRKEYAKKFGRYPPSEPGPGQRS